MSSSSTNRRTVIGRLFGRGPESPALDKKEDLPYDKSGPSFSPTSQASQQSTLPEVIENLGTGLFQVRTSLLAGPVWFADGAELILISSVAEAVAQEWSFNPAQKGLVVTFVYLGVLCGNLLSGPFGDNFGRRLPILVSFLFIFLFSVCSAMAWGFWSLSAFRFLVGCAIGVGQPAQQALVSEVTPTKWRIIFASTGQYLFAFGEVYSGCLILADDPQMKDIHWRTLLVAGAVPSVVFGLLAFGFLSQSPLFLACGGRIEETHEVLETMRRQNAASDVSLDFKPHRVICGGSGAQSHFSRMIKILFGPDYLATSIVLISSCFVLNLGYYGSLYAFPNVLSTGVSIGGTPAAGLIYGGLMELVGYTAGVLCILYFNRITVMKIYVICMGLALASFAIGAPHQTGIVYTFLTKFGYYGAKFFVAIGFLVFYLYATEVYPTAIRTTGTSVTFAGGRLAAMFASLIYELLLSACGTYTVFFWLMAGSCLVNFFLLRLLTVETYGQLINDPDEEDEEDDVLEGRSPAYGSTGAKSP